MAVFKKKEKIIIFIIFPILLYLLIVVLSNFIFFLSNDNTNYNKVNINVINNDTSSIEDTIIDNNSNSNVIENTFNNEENTIIDNKTNIKEEEIVKDEGNKKYISLTFDDGPSSNTIELVNLLESYNSSATFFMVGNRMKSRKEMVKAVYNSNSEVGSHSYSHKNMTKISEKEINYELNATNSIYHEITNDYLKLFRPPYGSYNEQLLHKDYIVVTWNVDTEDWKVKDRDKVYNHVIKNACDGCIVLMHEIHKPTIEAMKLIIPKLKEMNYEIVSVSKLMEIKNYTHNSNKVIRHMK